MSTPLPTEQATPEHDSAKIAALEAENRALREQLRALENAEARLTEERAQHALKTHFFANISHELRTPLTLSLAPLEELITRGDQLPIETRDEFLQTIYNNQLRLLKLINNLLDFAKIDAGKMAATFQLEDVVASLRFYVNTMNAAAQARRLRLVFRTDAEVMPIFVDHDKFEKIVMNLLSNAFKFTPAGGAIDVSLHDEDDDVCLRFADTGVGISARALPYIFDRFAQGDNAERRPYEGSGIGLAMVKEFVLQHGGAIDVESAEGRGTTFSVRLRKGAAHLDPTAVVSGLASAPESVRAYHLADALPTDDRDSYLPEAPAESLPRSTPRDLPVGFVYDSSALPSWAMQPDSSTILVVDDVADMRRFVAHVLGKRYRVLTARDGAEGLLRAREERPDLIVSDVSMPRMSGYQLCRAIRDDPALAHIPIILLSAKTDLARKLEGLEQGADDYLTKPFNASELFTRARNLLRLHHQERELIRALRALEERDRALTDDLQQARQFQQSILPPTPRVRGLAVDILYQPLDLVGGDIYACDAISDTRLRLFLADATGHGVQASLTTMLIKSEYEFIKRDGASPAELLAALNDRIVSAYGHLGMRFSAVCAEIDKDSRRLRYSTGGHPPPWLVHHGAVRELDGGGTFLGLVPEASFPSHDLPFGPGDRLYLFTDGVTDEWNPAGEAFGEERLALAIEEASSQGALAGAFVYDQLRRFIAGSKAQYDDMTLLGVWWGQPPGPQKDM